MWWRQSYTEILSLRNGTICLYFEDLTRKFQITFFENYLITTQVVSNEPLPADIVLLASSEAKNTAYVETMQLDG